MVISALVAALLVGAPPLPLAVLASAWVAPGPTAIVVIGFAGLQWLRRTAGPDRFGHLLLLDIAADLRSGMTLRAALAVDTRLPPPVVRMAAAGRPVRELAGALVASDVPGSRLLAPALSMVGEAGGSAASVFGSVAGMLIDDDLVKREIRTAVAGPLAQAVVVGGVPLAALGWSVVSGSFFDALDRGGVSAVLTVVGACQVLVGALVVWLLIRRVGRWR
jgi:Flp pilus assembly protein TadB